MTRSSMKARTTRRSAARSGDRSKSIVAPRAGYSMSAAVSKRGLLTARVSSRVCRTWARALQRGLVERALAQPLGEGAVEGQQRLAPGLVGGERGGVARHHPRQEGLQPRHLGGVAGVVPTDLSDYDSQQVGGNEHAEGERLVLHPRVQLSHQEAGHRVEQRDLVGTVVHLTPPSRSAGAPRIPSPPPDVRSRSAPGPTRRPRDTAHPAARSRQPSARCP